MGNELKNPIKFDTKSNILKDISEVVVDYICNKENIVIDHIDYNEDFYCHFLYNNKKKEHFKVWLELGAYNRDIINCVSIEQRNKINNFISTYNIEKDNVIAHYIFLILHEIGHAVYDWYFYNRLGNSKFTNYLALRDNIYSGIHMGLPVRKKKEFKENDSQFNYNYNPDELLATNYAYQNFYEIWNLLLSINLI